MKNSYNTVEINPAFADIKTIGTNLIPKNSNLVFNSVNIVANKNLGTTPQPGIEVSPGWVWTVAVQELFRLGVPAIDCDFDRRFQATKLIDEAFFSGTSIPAKLKIEWIDFKCTKTNFLFRFKLAKDEGTWHAVLSDVHYKGKWSVIESFDEDMFLKFTTCLLDIILVTCKYTKQEGGKWCQSRQMLESQLVKEGLSTNSIW